MQRKGQAVEHALSLINLLKQDIEVLQQLVEEIRDAEETDIAETIAKLKVQEKKQANQERRRLREEARKRAREWAEQTYPNLHKNKRKSEGPK